MRVRPRGSLPCGNYYGVALWPLACRAAIRDSIERNGERALRRVHAAIGTRIRTVEGAEDPFLDINNPADLEEAQRRA